MELGGLAGTRPDLGAAVVVESGRDRPDGAGNRGRRGRSRRADVGRVNVHVELVERVLKVRVVTEPGTDLNELAIVRYEVAVPRDVRRQVRVGERNTRRSERDYQNCKDDSMSQNDLLFFWKIFR